jgi:hypothetical protein
MKLFCFYFLLITCTLKSGLADWVEETAEHFADLVYKMNAQQTEGFAGNTLVKTKDGLES